MQEERFWHAASLGEQAARRGSLRHTGGSSSATLKTLNPKKQGRASCASGTGVQEESFWHAASLGEQAARRGLLRHTRGSSSSSLKTLNPKKSTSRIMCLRQRSANEEIRTPEPAPEAVTVALCPGEFKNIRRVGCQHSLLRWDTCLSPHLSATGAAPRLPHRADVRSPKP